MKRFSNTVIYAFIVALIIILYLNASYIVAALSFLPSSEIINSKFKILEAEGTGIRISGLISIFVYPAYIFFSRKRLENHDLIMMFAFFSLFMNVFFIDNAHIAGRLSRLTDYFLFPYVLASVAFDVNKNIGAIVLLPILLFAPFLFPSLYDFDEIISQLFPIT